MSLILEALRKSEAERRRGQAPDLFTELPPTVRRRETRFSPALWAVLAAAVLVAGAWFARQLWAPGPRPESVAAQAPADGMGRLRQPKQPSATPAPVDAASDAGGPGPGPGAVSVATSSAPASPAPTMASSPPRADVAADDRNQSRPIAVPSDTVPGQDAPIDDTVRTAPADPETTPAPPSPSAPPAPSGSVTSTLKLTDLGVEQRRQLPPLRMSMHLWDPDPARRFVIIDGTRHAEGDRIGAATVRQINADSVVLEWNGLQLRLPVR